MKKLISLLGGLLAVTISLSGCGMLFNPFGIGLPVETESPVLTMFSGGELNKDAGVLYYQMQTDDKERVAEDAQKYECIVAPKTRAMLYLDSNNRLFLKLPDGAASRVSNNVIMSSYSFSEDESTIAFLAENSQGSGADLYIQKVDDATEKTKVASGMSTEADRNSYRLSKKGDKIVYMTEQASLFRWVSEQQSTEGLAHNVTYFNTYADTEAYAFMNTEDEYYVKYANDTGAQKIQVSEVGNLRMSEDGLYAVYTAEYDWEKSYGELYFSLMNSEPVKLASNVKTFNVAAGNSLYYLNDEGNVFLKTIPRVKKSTYKRFSSYSDKLNRSSVERMCSKVKSYYVSPNGKNSAYIDTDDNLFFSYNGSPCVKYASDVLNVNVFDTRVLFENKKNRLVLNSVVSDTARVDEHNNIIAQLLTGYAADATGQNIVFTTSRDNSMMLCVDGSEPVCLVSDCEEFDLITFQNTTVYERKLDLRDIAGIYKNPDLEVAYKITEEGRFTLYEKGVGEESSVTAKGITISSAELISDDSKSMLSDNDVTFSITENGDRMMTINDELYHLEMLDDAGLRLEIERQKLALAEQEAEEKRKASAAKKAAELKVKKEEATERGESYLDDGVYVSSSETLYYSPSYSSGSYFNYTRSGVKSVYGYQVSEDGNTLWLKLYTTSSGYGGYNGYVWVPR